MANTGGGTVQQPHAKMPGDGDRGHLLMTVGIVTIIVAMLAVFFFLRYGDALRPQPKVDTFADNAYSETLRVVTDAEYAPFSYIDADGEYQGLDVELANELANRLGMNLELTLVSWSDANEMLRDGRADMIMNFETDLVTADSGLIASIPTTEKEYVVYGRDQVHSVAELYGAKIASLHQLPQLELGDGVTYIDSYDEIFQRLKDGEFDYAVCPVQVGNSFLDEFDMVGVNPSYAVSHVYGALVFLKGNEALRDRVNPVVRDLHESGFLDALDAKWVNHHYENTTVIATIENNPGFALFLVGLLLTLILMFVLYMYTQRRSHRAKAEYTRQLQESLEILRSARAKAYHDDLTGVRNKNAFYELEDEIQKDIDAGDPQPFAVAVCDVNGLKVVNDEQGHQAGDAYIQEACHLVCKMFDHSPVFRVGGDEFVVVLRGPDFENRAQLVAQMRDQVLKNQEEGGVVVAVGISDYAGDKLMSSVFERADSLMYENKASLKGARK